MTRTNTRDDLFDGVEIPRKPEPEAAKPDTTTANARSRTRSRRDTQPDGVPAARLAIWAGSLVGAVSTAIAWSGSVWFVAALAAVFVVAMIVAGILHARRNRRAKNRRGQRGRGSRYGMNSRSHGHGRGGGGARGALGRLRSKLGIGGSKNGGRGGGPGSGGRNGQARGGKLNPKNWGKRGKTAGQGGQTAASTGARTRGKKGRGGVGKSGKTSGSSASGSGRSRRSGGSGKTSGSGRSPRTGGADGGSGITTRNRSRQRRDTDPMTDRTYSARPGFWARRRLRKQAEHEAQQQADTTTDDTKKNEVKEEAKEEHKHDVYGDDFPFDDGGFPVYEPAKQTNKQTLTSTNTYDDTPIDDMGFPMYEPKKREEKPMSDDIISAPTEDPRTRLSKGYLRIAAEAEEKAKKSKTRADELEKEAAIYSRCGMDDAYLEAKRMHTKMTDAHQEYLGAKAAAEAKAAKVKSF